MEDGRIKRTKRFLSMALVELLAEKPVNEITVKELTERSDVNRATFYRHYRDIYDMLRQMEQELFGEFTAALGQEPPPENEAALERLYCRILRFVADRAELCGILFGPNGDRSLLAAAGNAGACLLRHPQGGRAGHGGAFFGDLPGFRLYQCSGAVAFRGDEAAAGAACLLDHAGHPGGIFAGPMSARPKFA